MYFKFDVYLHIKIHRKIFLARKLYLSTQINKSMTVFNFYNKRKFTVKENGLNVLPIEDYKHIFY